MPRLARLEDPEYDADWAPPATMPDAEYGNRADILATDIPAGATMTARAVARMYAALMHDVDGVRLLSDQRLREVTSVAVSDVDQIFTQLFGADVPVTRGLGYQLGSEGGDFDGPTVFGMAGSGGTAAFADTASGVAVAIMKNRNTMGDYSTFNEVATAVATALANS